VIHVRQKLGSSERRACRTIGVALSTQRYKASPEDNDSLRLTLVRLAKQYGREALCVAAKPRMGNAEVLEALYPLFLKHGKPEFIRSDNGPEFIAENFHTWLTKVKIKPIRIYPRSPWENGYKERFNGTLRREVLNAEWFTSIRQAQVVIETWLKQYNHIRPHQALNMRPPVPETLSGSGT